MTKDGKKKVMVAGLPGSVATTVAAAIMLEEDLSLCIWGLAEKPSKGIDISKSITLILFPPEEQKEHLTALRGFVDVIVDFPSSEHAVKRSVQLYCDVGIPFVMAANGVNLRHLSWSVKSSNISAVLYSPNRRVSPVDMALSAVRRAIHHKNEAGMVFSIKDAIL